MNATVLIRDGRKKAITRLASPTPASYRIFQFSVIPSFLTAAVSHVPDNVALNFFFQVLKAKPLLLGFHLFLTT